MLICQYYGSRKRTSAPTNGFLAWIDYVRQVLYYGRRLEESTLMFLSPLQLNLRPPAPRKANATTTWLILFLTSTLTANDVAGLRWHQRDATTLRHAAQHKEEWAERGEKKKREKRNVPKRRTQRRDIAFRTVWLHYNEIFCVSD